MWKILLLTKKILDASITTVTVDYKKIIIQSGRGSFIESFGANVPYFVRYGYCASMDCINVYTT